MFSQTSLQEPVPGFSLNLDLGPCGMEMPLDLKFPGGNLDRGLWCKFTFALVPNEVLFFKAFTSMMALL